MIQQVPGTFGVAATASSEIETSQETGTQSADFK